MRKKISEISDKFNLSVENDYGNRFQSFQNLMKWRVRDILLVSSMYDLYLFEEDGRLYELIRKEYQGLHLSHAPELTRVSSGKEAVSLVNEEGRFDLIITTLHIEDMSAVNFAKMIKESGIDIPVVLLAHDNKELKYLFINNSYKIFEKVFIWQGDYRILIGIIKFIEDGLNVENDTNIVGVQSIILIEDNVKYYSTFLPIIYTELLKQSQGLISEGINLSHKFLRMRARPKILLCSTFEEALVYFEKYEKNILGIISDIDFPKNGEECQKAGIEFASLVRNKYPDIPILLLSDMTGLEKEAKHISTYFVKKDSALLLEELRQFMLNNFSFGDFVFKTPDGREVDRANDLLSLEEKLKTIPIESLLYHGERNDFSNWLKARTEFLLAYKLRPRKITDYSSAEDIRKDLINTLYNYRTSRQKGIIADFKKESFNPEASFARIGGGSLGGKARGLGFVNTLINNFNFTEEFKNVNIFVPAAIVIATDVFDQFMYENNLKEFAFNCVDDREITKRFIEAGKFPCEVINYLKDFLKIMKSPLAIRSSSLLEDSQFHPFAGVYETYMIPNNHPEPDERLNELLITIKRVFASTYHKIAKDYIRMTSYRLEEEKMAVIIQSMIGNSHTDRFYPDLSGVAKSYNFYPIFPQKSTDGIASVALGLGKTVVDGGNAVRFCPKYPTNLIQFYSVEETLNNSQRDFYALNLKGKVEADFDTYDKLLNKLNIEVAELDGTLDYIGATYSKENDAIYEGISRSGMRVITFSHLLKNNISSMPVIIELLIDLCSTGMGTPVEMEFAMNLNIEENKPAEFGILQMRPLVVNIEAEELKIEEYNKKDAICISEQVLGNGMINDIRDIIFIDINKFERSKSIEVVREVSLFNELMITENRPYLLIGFGRWGTLDPWLGIPVNWSQIAGAKAIIEAGFKDMAVEPSQGSHFFQNLTSFMIGYFTVNEYHQSGYIDWDWLLSQKIFESKNYTKHLRFNKPIIIKMNGHENKGIILKPGINFTT